MIQKDISKMLGMRTSSEKVVDQLERNVAILDIEDELDTLQRSRWLGKQPMVQTPTTNEEPIQVLAKKQLYSLNTKNYESDEIWDSPSTWLLLHAAHFYLQ